MDQLPWTCWRSGLSTHHAVFLSCTGAKLRSADHLLISLQGYYTSIHYLFDKGHHANIILYVHLFRTMGEIMKELLRPKRNELLSDPSLLPLTAEFACISNVSQQANTHPQEGSFTNAALACWLMFAMLAKLSVRCDSKESEELTAFSQHLWSCPFWVCALACGAAADLPGSHVLRYPGDGFTLK